MIHLDTTHSKHAVEIAKELPLKYDAMVVVSGDGLIHEIMNGFAEHADYAQAFDVPLVPVPAGSGNATSLNILGRKVSMFHVDIRKANLTRAAGWQRLRRSRIKCHQR